MDKFYLINFPVGVFQGRYKAFYVKNVSMLVVTILSWGQVDIKETPFVIVSQIDIYSIHTSQIYIGRKVN